MMIPQAGSAMLIPALMGQFKRVLHFFSFLYAAALRLMYIAPAVLFLMWRADCETAANNLNS